MLEALESLGGNIQCASSREALMYQCATFNSSVPSAVALLAETIREPRITEEEVQQQLQTAEYEIGEIWSKPELIVPEVQHVAAYKDNTLGNPLLCPRERLGEIDKPTVESYRDLFFRPERIVLAFTGVSHDDAVRLARQNFGDMRSIDVPSRPSPPLDGPTSHSPVGARDHTSPHALSAGPSTSQTSRLLSKIPFFKNLSTSAAHNATVLPDAPSLPPTVTDSNAPSHYTGGFLALDPLPPPTNPALPRLSHILLSFEGVSVTSDDIYPLAILQTLLGGGGSFSAGGPGKGMFSRLYTNVLNQYGWVENCMASNQAYTDSGLFGISASCQPAKIADMLTLMCRELYALTLDTSPMRLQQAEVDRAKNALRSTVLMNLESRMVGLEDLGRQIQVHGRKIGVKETCAKIEALTINDLRRVASLVLGGLVDNVGKGTGVPTVVLQESAPEHGRWKPFGWPEIQERIAQFKLGRR